MRSMFAKKGRWLLIAIPYMWLLSFFVIPFLIVLQVSLSVPQEAQPPYEPLIKTVHDTQGGSHLKLNIDTSGYALLLQDDLYIRSLLGSLKVAFFATLMTLLIGYPIAYGISRAPPRLQKFFIFLVILPFVTSFLLRIYAIKMMIKDGGFLTLILESIIKHGGPVGKLLSFIDVQHLHLFHAMSGVYIGIVYSYLPFIILPLYAVFQKLDDTLLEAGADLGASPFKQFLHIIWPLSLPGVFAGSFLVFIPVMGEFVIPNLLGPSNILMIGGRIWDDFFMSADWQTASAMSVVLLIVLLLPIIIFQKFIMRTSIEIGDIKEEKTL